MRHMQPVLWTKGVLLTPQHLQAQDRHHEDTLAFQVGALTFCPWGFSTLTFDHAALLAGTLVINEAAGRFPDGLLFDAPQAGPTPPPKLVTDAFGPDQRQLTAYLAVPEYRPGARNIAPWQSDEQLVRDETTGLTERPIQVAPPSLRLLLEGENIEGYTTLPVARIVRDDAGKLSFDHTFVPPLLDFVASDVLMNMARRLVERLAAKGASLAGSRRQRNQGLLDFSVADVGSFWLLSWLWAGIVVMRLPFAPISWVSAMTHRSLEGEDMREVSYLGVYILASMALRPFITRLFGPQTSPAAGAAGAGVAAVSDRALVGNPRAGRR